MLISYMDLSLSIHGIYGIIWEGGNPFLHFIYNWSFFRGCLDGYYDIIFVGGIRILIKIGFSRRMGNRQSY
jgi:hypothetical protein